MTIEQRLKWLEQNEVYLANSGWTIIQALRKAIEQRDNLAHKVFSGIAAQESKVGIYKLLCDQELLEILDGEK